MAQWDTNHRFAHFLLPVTGKALAAAGAAWLIAGLAAPAAAVPGSNRLNPADVIQVSHQVLPPLAHARFCLRYPVQCAPSNSMRRPASSAKAGLAELQQINLSVNRALEPQEDAVFQGIADEWVLETSKGDCEDYALLKRKYLLELGWPSSQLRIATALTKDGTGHAVLIARFQGVDFALDSLKGAIRPWHETGYRFLKIQSKTDPRLWFSVENRGETENMSHS